MSDLSDHDIVYVDGEYKTKAQIKQDLAEIRGSPAEHAVETAPVPAYDVFRCAGCDRQVSDEERGGAPWANFCKRCRGVEESGGDGPQENQDEQEAAKDDPAVQQAGDQEIRIEPERRHTPGP